MKGLVITGAVLIAGSLGVACKGKAAVDREVDHGLVRIDMANATLRHDTVGHDQWASRATFVLVDAYNEHSEDLLVTLGGELVDAGGTPVGAVRAESLRIPAGGVRTFALIDREQGVREQAVASRVDVLGAYVPDYPPLVQITDGNAYTYDERLVVTGVVRNAVDREVRVIVLAGFYDGEGKLLQRPFTTMYLPGDGQSNARFAGPPGSVKGYIFVGDMVY